MKQHLLFILLWGLLIGPAFSEENKLLFVQIVFRHGDRAPIDLYPNDPNPPSVWPEGLAALTTLGKKQQYALGKYFRSRYSNFTTSSPLEVKVISSEADRCLKSALTNLASFYAPDSEWSFDKSLPWQPISVHYLPKKQDKYLETDSDCPRAVEEQQKVIQSHEGQRILKEHEEMFRNLSVYSGYPIANWTKASYLHDVLSIERIIANMDAKINGMITNLKFQIYSAHDTTIAVVLDALNLFNMIAPPYASALLFELFEMPDGVKTVRMLYQNSSKPEEKIDPLQILILEGCSEFCPLDFFINFTSPLIPEDWGRECQLDKTFVEKIQERKVTIGWFLILIAVVMAVMSIFLLWRMYSRRQDKKGISAVKYSSLDGP
ncbi:Testicular acid phosphatase like protein [Argiope bruennichi]|uniref:acid phosphatase n=1 Tax=Argiope bruennichi TaxID=94029 RepID=A0A8T0FZJ8_ARGBR|nr:Testicular acid phosphatase like protein [Argiope bruennichi]